MTNRPKMQGTAEESFLVATLHAHGFPQARRLAEGGSKDEGDVEVWPGGPVIEAKSRANLNLHATYAKSSAKSERFVAVWWKKLTRKGDNQRRTPDGVARVVGISVPDFIEYLQLRRDHND